MFKFLRFLKLPKWMLRISFKLYFLVGLSSALLGAIMWIAVTGSESMSMAAHHIHKASAGVERAGRIEVQFEQIRGLVTRTPGEMDLKNQKRYQAGYQAALKSVRQVLAEQRKNASVIEKVTLDGLDAAFTKLEGASKKIFEFAYQFAAEQANAVVNGAFAEAEGEIQMGIDSLVEAQKAQAKTSVEAMFGDQLMRQIARVNPRRYLYLPELDE